MHLQQHVDRPRQRQPELCTCPLTAMRSRSTPPEQDAGRALLVAAAAADCRAASSGLVAELYVVR